MSGTDEPGSRKGRAIPVKGWEFRYDSPPLEGAPARVESGDILVLFRAWARRNRLERRESPRYVSAETRAYLGWWKGSRFLVTPAELINLSRGGALVEIVRRPPTSQPVWICLGRPEPAHYVQARALEVSAGNGGVQLVRLQFHTPCPADFFRATGRRGEPGEPPAAS